MIVMIVVSVYTMVNDVQISRDISNDSASLAFKSRGNNCTACNILAHDDASPPLRVNDFNDCANKVPADY